jgi:hypothetical protein
MHRWLKMLVDEVAADRDEVAVDHVRSPPS